jgi:hypothetical protein
MKAAPKPRYEPPLTLHLRIGRSASGFCVNGSWAASIAPDANTARGHVCANGGLAGPKMSDCEMGGTAA